MKDINFNLKPNDYTFGSDLNEELRSIDENTKELGALSPTSVQKDALDGAESPSGSNVFATMADVPTADELAAIQGATAPSVSNLFMTFADRPVTVGTPVNAVASSSVLTIGTNPTEGETVSIGGQVYKFREVLGDGVAATGTLTMNTTQPEDGDTITTGNTTYTFKTALSVDPTVPNEILISAVSTEGSMDNLIAAIEGTGVEGTDYSVDTVSQGAITASKATTDTMLVTYDSVGFLGNQFDTLEAATYATWGATTLTGGIDAQEANDVLIGGTVELSIDNLVLAITVGSGEGTNYGTGTVVNASATAAKASAATMTAAAKIKGVSGDLIALAESLTDGSWAAGTTFLTGGVNGTVGVIREMYLSDNKSTIYVAMKANTIADDNWMKITMETL